jgi:hypothetical protein
VRCAPYSSKISTNDGGFYAAKPMCVDMPWGVNVGDVCRGGWKNKRTNKNDQDLSSG